MSREAGELLRRRLLQPGGAKEAHCMVEDLLSPGSGTSSSSGGDGGLCQEGGGWYPDPSAMLLQQGLVAA